MPVPDSSPAPVIEFVQRGSEKERKVFYISQQGSQWWSSGGRKDSDRGWAEIVQQSNWKCIHCGLDLAASTHALAESTEEYVVPRPLSGPNGAETNVADNIAACCAGCTTLKGEFVPPAAGPCWKSRKAYVKASFRFISGRRLKNFIRYRDHVEAALKMRAGQ